MLQLFTNVYLPVGMAYSRLVILWLSFWTSMAGTRVEPVMKIPSGVLSVKKKQLYDYVNTSRRWSPEQRATYPKFEWTVFRNSDPVRDKELLDQAHDEGVSASEVKRRLFPNLESPVKLLRDATSALFKLLSNKQLDPAPAKRY